MCVPICKSTCNSLKTFSFEDTSEFIKIDLPNGQSQTNGPVQVNQNESANTKSSNTQKPNYTFRWNSEPNHVLCLFPYVIGFANQSIEIRLFVNGSLINSLTMSNVKLIASKVKIFNFLV
jgi:hypothetical protein